MRRKNYKLWLVMLVILLTLVGCGQKHKEIQKHEENKTQSDQVLCKANFCKEPALAASGCCEAHTCQVAGCQNATAARWGKYCQEHMCSREDCNNPRVEGSDLCTAHNDPNQVCIVEGCTRLKRDGIDYCSVHKTGFLCGYRDCTNPTENFSTFCSEHQIADKELHSAPQDTPNDNESSGLSDMLIIDETGKQIWKVYAKSNEFHFKASCSGPGYFGIKLLDSNQDFYALVMNETGSYELDKSIYGLIEGEMYYIQVEFSRGTITYSWSGTYGD